VTVTATTGVKKSNTTINLGSEATTAACGKAQRQQRHVGNSTASGDGYTTNKKILKDHH